MGFSRFISDNEEDEYRRGLGEEDPNKDWAWLVSAMRKPEEAIAPASTDPRQPRSGGGGIDAFTSARDAAGGDAPKGEGDTGTVSPTAKRIQIAQWGTEDPDEDRVTPESIGQNTKMLSSTDNTAPTKPPGPDSPAPNYKDPASSFLEASGYAARKKAYDQDWDPSGKWKGGFKIETTQQRMARREMQQRDVMEAEQEGLRMFDRFLGQEEQQKPRALGVQTFRTADGKKQVYAIHNDGTSKLVMEGLDEAAKKTSPYLSDAITWDATTGYGYKQRSDNQQWERQDVPAPGAPPIVGYGPTGPDNMLPMTKKPASASRFITRPEGTDLVEIPTDGQPRVALPARAKTKAPGVGGAGGSAAELDRAARAEATRLLRGDPLYGNAANVETKTQMFVDAVESAKKRIQASRSGVGAAVDEDDEDTVLNY